MDGGRGSRNPTHNLGERGSGNPAHNLGDLIEGYANKYGLSTFWSSMVRPQPCTTPSSLQP